jgi:pimeloyl-ACP methyl ester carboxylesterase
VNTRRVAVEPDVSLAVDIWSGTSSAHDAGSAPAAFLLVHGLASNARLWWGSARRLAELGHAAAAVDQRGHGRADKPDDGYTLDRACEDALAVISELRESETGWEGPIVIAGQSWGANVALELGYRNPEIFSGVVCVDGGTIELSHRFPDWEGCAAALAPPRSTGRPASEIESYMKQAHPGWPQEGLDAQMANFLIRADGTVEPRLSFENHMKLLRALWDHLPSTRYAGMKVPVLFVPADSGAATSWTHDKHASVEAAVTAIPRSGAHWFSPADHDIHAQFPVELADVMHTSAIEGLLA